MPVRPVLFSSGKGSNFYLANVRMPHPFPSQPGEMALYSTNEHRFQAIKAKYCQVGTRNMHDMIASAKSPQVAKSMGREVPLDDTELLMWDKYNALREMLDVNLNKFWVHERCRKWLLSTGTARLVEHRPDPIWADNMDGSGQNLLGKVLELVRAAVS